MIKIEKINKYFGSLHILKDVNFEIKKSEIVTIVGKSGAGKTTLLQIIGTLLKQDSGKIYFDDKDLTKLKSKALASFRNKHIGFVFQFHNLLPEFTAFENVCIPGFIAGTDTKEVKKRAAELLDYLGLSDRLDHKPQQLSGGEQQRVAVARSLINGPDVILADEPSGNLDTKNKQELHNLFFDLRDKFGHTFIIVTHDEQLALMSDRTIRLRDGSIIEDHYNT